MAIKKSTSFKAFSRLCKDQHNAGQKDMYTKQYECHLKADCESIVQKKKDCREDV